MRVRDIYSAVLLEKPDAEQFDFIMHFNNCLRFLISRYPAEDVFVTGWPESVRTVDDDIGVYDEYAYALQAGVLSSIGDGEGNFAEAADLAWKNVWRRKSGGRQIMRSDRAFDIPRKGRNHVRQRDDGESPY